MDFFQALAIICFAALLTILIWQARCSFFRRRIGGKRTKVTVVFTSNGSAGELEQSVKGLIWLVSNNTFDRQTEIEIRNSEAHPETLEMARILENEFSGVVRVE